jgi:hypothetical protein
LFSPAGGLGSDLAGHPPQMLPLLLAGHDSSQQLGPQLLAFT